jgi:hypothetical protein
MTKLSILEAFDMKLFRLYALLEQYATAKSNPDQYLPAMQRLFQQLKLQFMGAGYDAISQLCGSMEVAAKRGLSPSVKLRILREGVGSLKFQLELVQRSIISEDEAEMRKQEAAKELVKEAKAARANAAAQGDPGAGTSEQG